MDVSRRRALVRVDINVPLKDGKVADSTRIRKIQPTVNRIVANGGRAILIAHLGRPKGQRSESLSLRRILPDVSKWLGKPARFADLEDFGQAEEKIRRMAHGQIMLLENIRFHPGEEANDPEFARRLAGLGDFFCNDAFSASHRGHASTVGVAAHLPSCAGRLMEAELSALESALSSPARPLTAIVGGAKVSTKLGLLSSLVKKVDRLVIGGGMANTFLAAKGYDVGASLCEHGLAPKAREIMEAARAESTELMLPEDVVVAEAMEPDSPAKVVRADSCPGDRMILDIGPDTSARIASALESGGTLVWNGPLGAAETPPFDRGTVALAAKAAGLTRASKLVSIAGGGDVVAALNACGASDGFSYISTAGGAFLEWVEGKELPGVAALGAG